ncbi:MAG: hypothetical protein K2Q12_05405 [Rickettsiales bacterium]|nr:hypothetical protein [Rickettsiales bacterium]
MPPLLTPQEHALLVASIHLLAEEQPLLIRPEQRVLGIQRIHAQVLAEEMHVPILRDKAAVEAALRDALQRTLIIDVATLPISRLEQMLDQTGHGLTMYMVQESIR